MDLKSIALILLVGMGVIGGDRYAVHQSPCKLEKSDGTIETGDCLRDFMECTYGPLSLVNENGGHEALYFCRLKMLDDDFYERPMGDILFSKACYATSQSGQVLKENMCADGFSCSLSSYTFNVEGEGNIQVTANFCQKDEVDKGEMPILKTLGAQVKRGAGHDPSNGPSPGVVQMIQKIKEDQAANEKWKAEVRERLAKKRNKYTSNEKDSGESIGKDSKHDKDRKAHKDGKDAKDSKSKDAKDSKEL